MRFKARIDGADHEVAARADGALSIDTDSFAVGVERPSPDRRVVQVGDAQYEVRVVEGGRDSGKFVLELGGERITVDVSEPGTGPTMNLLAAPGGSPALSLPVSPGGAAAAGAAAADPAGTARIVAPMPGRIANVLVKVGDELGVDDVVLILEAMKMENELTAPRQGRVKSVLVSKGDLVKGGQVLLELV